MEGMRYHRGVPYSERDLQPPADYEDTRTILLDAAIEVFLEKGYQGARVQEIARRAGVTTGAIYANFENKADLLAEAIQHRGVSALGDMSEGLGSDVASLDLVQLMVARNLSDSTHEQKRLVLDLLAMSARDDEVAEAVKSHFTTVDETLKERLERAVTLGLVDPELEIDAVAYIIRTAMIGATVSQALGLPVQGEAELATFLKRLLPPQLLTNHVA